MSSARERVLGDIRRALRGAGDRERVRERIEDHPRHILPAYGEERETRFFAHLQAAEATVARVGDDAALGAEIGRYLAEIGAGDRIVVANPALAARLAPTGGLTVETGPIGDADPVAAAPAFCGIAETGTLMLCSGEGDPTRLNFLPDYHIVVLAAGRLVGWMEDAWDLLRAEAGDLPRTVNFISGPSKTADVEQTVEYGAHGPRALHVILTD